MAAEKFYLNKEEFEILYHAVWLKIVEFEFGGKKPGNLKTDAVALFEKFKGKSEVVWILILDTGTKDTKYFARRRRQKSDRIFFDELLFYNCLVYVGILIDEDDKLIKDVPEDYQNSFKRAALRKTEKMAKEFFADHNIQYRHKYSNKPQAEGKANDINAEAMRLGNDEHTKKFLKTLRENGLEKFMIQPVHYYYSTKSENGKLYWCHAIFDFTTPVSPEANFLQSLSEIPNLSKSLNIKYSAKIIKESSDDPILLSIRYQGTHEKICHNIFDNMRSYDKSAGGFLYHDDWMGEMRLSPCLLSFEKLTEQDTTGALPHEQCLTLQEFWNKIFKKDNAKVIFEEYNSPYNL